VSETAMAERFAGVEGARRRRFAAALSRDVVSYADGWSSAVGDGKAFAESFAAEGESLKRLVGHMAGTIEGVAATRIGRVRGTGQLTQASIEGGPSGLSRDIALAELTGSERLYRGAGNGGVGDLVRSASTPIDERVKTAFAAAIAAVEKLAVPLEQAARADR